MTVIDPPSSRLIGDRRSRIVAARPTRAKGLPPPLVAGRSRGTVLCAIGSTSISYGPDWTMRWSIRGHPAGEGHLARSGRDHRLATAAHRCGGDTARIPE